MSPLLWAAGVLSMLTAWSVPVAAQWTDSTLWGVHGNVAAVARVGNTLYVGGSFNTVGPNSGGGVLLDRQTGEPVAGNPRVAGAVKAVVPDGSGGWFIGGVFAGVGGVPHRNLAHVLPGGEVAPWNPVVDGTVYALVLSGNQLYLGGSFTAVDGMARASLAAVDAESGQVLDWHADANAAVYALTLGTRALYAGGDFSTMASVTRNSVAALDPSSGAVTSWNPDVGFEGAPGKVRALAVAGDTVYIGGDFISVGPQLRHRVASIDALSGAATSWDPDASAPLDDIAGDPIVEALAIRGTSIFVGGYFDSIGGQARSGFAELDRVAGTVSNLQPIPSAVDISALSVQDSTLFLCGGFTTIAGQPRRFCAELNLRTGLPTAFAPRPDEPVDVLAASGVGVYVGGGLFFSIGQQWRTRRGLAAFDLKTGAVRDWDPNPDGLFTGALLATHGKLYVGGYFSTLAGQVRYGLAAFDTTTGALTDWNPVANSVVGCLAVAGDTLYVGGYFTTMSGQPRARLASFDLNTGALTSWNPSPDWDVYGMSISQGVVYIAGIFGSIGGYTRKGAAAVDAVTGAILPWDPEADLYCLTTAVVGDTVFVAGAFNTLGGLPRGGLGAVDRTTGQVLPWTADSDNSVYCLAVLNDTLFVGGGFSSIAGQSRSGLAALDLRSGAVLPWNPDLGSNAWLGKDTGGGAGALEVVDHTLYFGGGFWRAGMLPATCVAAVSFAPPPAAPPRPLAFALLQNFPNPAQAATTVRFELPDAARTMLTIYDIQGRRVATPLNGAVIQPGPHEVNLPLGTLRPGMYLYRLEAGSRTATRKMLVVR